MTAQPIASLPSYGSASLSDLLPSVLAGFGVPGEARVLDLPVASRVCVLMIDGLGAELLGRFGSHAPFLAGLRATGTELTAGFPSTTATSLSSLGTGLTPGEHGLLGFEFYLPQLGRPMNALAWNKAVDPVTLQPRTTAFERAAAAGVSVSRVGPRSFNGSGLTEAGLRGGRYLAAETPGQRVAAAAEALREGDRSLVYVYFGDLDRTGHLSGCESPAWRFQLEHVDRLAEQIAGALPAGSVLLVTADHGMVDVPDHARYDIARTPALDAGVEMVAGEPRASYVHTRPGAAADVLAAWQERLSHVAWVVSRDQAIDGGWFGPSVSGEMALRIGDVVVAAREPVAVVDSRRMRPELLSLVGMHGSLTPAEQLVPLLSFPVAECSGGQVARSDSATTRSA